MRKSIVSIAIAAAACTVTGACSQPNALSSSVGSVSAQPHVINGFSVGDVQPVLCKPPTNPSSEARALGAAAEVQDIRTTSQSFFIVISRDPDLENSKFKTDFRSTDRQKPDPLLNAAQKIRLTAVVDYVAEAAREKCVDLKNRSRTSPLTVTFHSRSLRVSKFG